MLQGSVLDSFHSEIQGPVFLSIGTDTKLDMLKTFDLNKPFDLHLDPPSSQNPPLVELCKMAKILLLQQISILQMWNQESGYSPPHQQTMK